MRLLIVEDDVAVRRLVVDHLESQGVAVTAAGTVSAALTALRHTSFDVVILDLTLPDASGLDVLRGARDLGHASHVVILSGAGTETDRVRALELGADDYVVKPFFVKELAARIMAVRRRHDIAEARGLEYGPLSIDLAGRQVTLHGAPLDLATKEFDLLAYLAARPGHVFSRDDLLRAVWQSATDWQRAATVTEHVRRLRGKIERDPLHPCLLRTARGAGYQFDPASLVAPVEDRSTLAPPPHREDLGCLILLDGVIVSADDGAVALLGAVSEAEVLGQDGLDFIAAQSQTAARARRSQTDSGQSPRSQIVVIRRLDRTETYVEISSSPIKWNGATTTLMILRPTADPSALRHLVTGVFSEVSDAVIVTDPESHIRSWNGAAERLYGWAEHEVLGRHISDVVPFAANDDGNASPLEALEATGRWHGEGQQLTRDGSVVSVWASTSLVNDDAGEPALIVSVNRLARPTVAVPTPGSELEADIRRGLECDEFVVHYQPVVALADRHLVSLEALVRWNHPIRGVLAPPMFIDAAERTGMIVALGRVVLDKACRQMAEWRRSGLDLEIAVNLSTRQLADPRLFDDITRTLHESGCSPDALWLEVTETALVEDVDFAADLLHRLAALGVRIAIDDFGTGWASLTYLKQFPVHALKIDRSFVAGVDRNPQDAAIARSILSLADELDLIVVAEGVETVAQQSVLQALGCSIGQGYLYGKATPAATVPVQRASHLRGRVRSHNI